MVAGPGAQPRVLLIGRLALYGPGVSRPHDEMITVTAPWTETGRGAAKLKPFGTRGDETTIAQVDAALGDPRRPPAAAIERARAWVAKDAAELEPELRRRAAELRAQAARALEADRRRRAAAHDAGPGAPRRVSPIAAIR